MPHLRHFRITSLDPQPPFPLATISRRLPPSSSRPVRSSPVSKNAPSRTPLAPTSRARHTMPTAASSTTVSRLLKEGLLTPLDAHRPATPIQKSHTPPTPKKRRLSRSKQPVQPLSKPPVRALRDGPPKADCRSGGHGQRIPGDASGDQGCSPGKSVASDQSPCSRRTVLASRAAIVTHAESQGAPQEATAEARNDRQHHSRWDGSSGTRPCL